LSESAVKTYAVQKGLHILQPEKLKNRIFVRTLLAPSRFAVVVAFRMLPEVVWSMPGLGRLIFMHRYCPTIGALRH
jgi:methionyl-tRNA formyltransferase